MIMKFLAEIHRISFKSLNYIREHGICYFLNRAVNYIEQKYLIKNQYKFYLRRNRLSKRILQEQCSYEFTYNPLISILVPVYETPPKFLDELIDSVQKQTYKNWELCLSDGAGSQSITKKYIEAYIKDDHRIIYRQSSHKLGIAANTNQAIDMAKGEYYALLDHDDLLTKDALFEYVKVINEHRNIELIYSDEDKISMNGKQLFAPYFKPDFNLDLLRSNNYICHFLVMKKELIEKVGLYKSDLDGSQDYDYILRAIEHTSNIYHISKVLYHWRSHKNSTAENPESKLYAFEAGKRALQNHYDRLGIPATVEHGSFYGSYKTNYLWSARPKLSVLIPNKDHIADLRICIDSLIHINSYKNIEIIIIENNSTDINTFKYYSELEKTYEFIKVIKYTGDFNYSKINNYGMKYANGDYLLLLNNDTKIINKDCIWEMMQYCLREDVGVVGARLYYEDGSIQHAGVIIGLGGIAGHAFAGQPHTDPGYFGRICCPQNYSAVTAACMMVKKSVFIEIGGLNEEFQVAFNDIDFCLRVREKGYLIVYNPYAELFHYESKSRGLDDTAEKHARFNQEIELFRKYWSDLLESGDPYYNRNLSLDKANFSLKTINS